MYNIRQKSITLRFRIKLLISNLISSLSLNLQENYFADISVICFALCKNT